MLYGAPSFSFQSTLPARGATTSKHTPLSRRDFNPRSLHGERHRNRIHIGGRLRFQSTLPARGATRQVVDVCRVPQDFNPRSLHGERPHSCVLLIPFRRISIHAPCTGSDLRVIKKITGLVNISIHAPCTGSDAATRGGTPDRLHFNPRSLHGERPRKVTILSIRIIGFAQKVYHKTVLLRISLAENAVILPEKP